MSEQQTPHERVLHHLRAGLSHIGEANRAAQAVAGQYLEHAANVGESPSEGDGESDAGS